jgi:glyoxylase-like metal-dependent hydrolase (beta-lactamase superfamily II)
VPENRFERVHDRVYRLPCPFEGGGLVNLYLVRGEKTAIVDTGVLGTPTNFLAPALEPMGLSLGDVDMVLNTHGHMDHLGGNSELKDAGADIALHRDDAQLAQSNRAHTEKATDSLRALGLDKLAPGREAFLLRLLGREVGVDRMLEDGDVVDLGADVRLLVVHTPGHTPGSVCYWWEAAGLLITGDSIQARGSRPGGLPVIEDPAAYRQTLDRAEAVGAQTLLMGHAFKGAAGDLGPVASGPRVGEVFRESVATHEALSRAFEQAVAEAPGAGGGEIARRAIEAVRDRLRLEDEPASGFPPSGIMTLPNYLRLARA